MINKLTGPFTGLISKIPGMASKKPVEVKTKRTALSCLKSCFTCAKKPKQVVVMPKPSMTTLAKKALNDSKQFAVGHKKALIGATAIGLAGAAGYAFRETIKNSFFLSSQQPPKPADVSVPVESDRLSSAVVSIVVLVTCAVNHWIGYEKKST
ncbi:MAG: hypothetical protein RLZZ453_273 [Chlamydiota bacterium]